MKSKISLIVFSGLLFIVMSIFPFKPVIIIKNGTDKKLYLSLGESTYGIEPEPGDIDKIKRKKPEILASGGEIKIKPSLSALIKNGTEIDIGWRIDGQYEYNSVGGGWRNFLLTSNEGACSVHIVINEGYNNDILKYEGNNYCIKKIKPFRVKY